MRSWKSRSTRRADARSTTRRRRSNADVPVLVARLTAAGVKEPRECEPAGFGSRADVVRGRHDRRGVPQNGRRVDEARAATADLAGCEKPCREARAQRVQASEGLLRQARLSPRPGDVSGKSCRVPDIASRTRKERLPRVSAGYQGAKARERSEAIHGGRRKLDLPVFSGLGFPIAAGAVL